MSRSAEFNMQDVSVRVFNWRNLRRVDWMLPIFVVLLAVAGWVTMYSASRSSDTVFFYKQVAFFCAGLVGAAVIVCIDYRALVAWAPAMYLAALGLLVAVLALGHEAKGAERWFRLGPCRFAAVGGGEDRNDLRAHVVHHYPARAHPPNMVVCGCLRDHRHPDGPDPQTAQPRHCSVLGTAGGRHALCRRMSPDALDHGRAGGAGLRATLVVADARFRSQRSSGRGCGRCREQADLRTAPPPEGAHLRVPASRGRPAGQRLANLPEQDRGGQWWPRG